MPGMSTRFKWAKHDIAKKGGTTCIFCSWQKSPYWHPGRRRHIIPIWNWVGGGSILPARVCPHLSSPDEGGARARANTKVHSKPAITWVLSLVCPPKCQAHYIEHRYTYIPKVYTTHIYGELCSKSCNFIAQFSSTNKHVWVYCRSKLECSVETTLKDLQFWSNVYESEQFRFRAMILKTHLINMLCNFY